MTAGAFASNFAVLRQAHQVSGSGARTAIEFDQALAPDTLARCRLRVDILRLPQLTLRIGSVRVGHILRPCHLTDDAWEVGMRRTCRRRLVALWLLAIPAAAFAQQTNGGIAGVARDASGAVLPGVTVEASSPVLIERVRVVTTDGEGRYNIVDLPPGTYTVAFSLVGFSTAKREGLELSSGFTATVNIEMRVGSLEETITVSGSSPIVDTQNVRKQVVATRDVLDALPTSTKSIYTLVALAPGFTGVNDVGGRYFSEAGAYHGKRGTKVYFDGMGIENSAGNSSYQINAAVVEEMVLQTSGISAEVNADGPVMNVVPKEGGNTFRTILSGTYSGKGMESGNLTDELRGGATGGCALDPVDRSSAGRAQWPLGVVRHVPRPADVAGDTQAQVQRHQR